ncbi:MAG TPA: segregation/condensation protein A [Thermodesulfobacteriota bacterium]|nr:segregation/condensation protein A [Thermodesulfobacteriota bacterium]
MAPENSYSEDRSDYTFRLEGFEGPLDLLLHLIQKNELDIFNIPISLITEQYLEYLHLMKVLNLDVAGEYLLMASTLLHIKSRMLLPKSSEVEEEEEEDPRAELVRRLLEYQKYKNAALEMEKRPLLERDVFIRLTPPEPEQEPEEEKIEVNLFELLEAFREVLKRVKPETVHEVMLEHISVEAKIPEILAILEKENRSIAFHRLFPEQASRRLVVVTLLAILELVKMKRIRIFQLAAFETIRISPV